jgi:hypothetical protein
MDGLMRVRFVRSSRHGKKGQIKELFSGVADTLIRRGFCVAIKDGRAGELETASIAPQEQAVRRRGRPRKVR